MKEGWSHEQHLSQPVERRAEEEPKESLFNLLIEGRVEEAIVYLKNLIAPILAAHHDDISRVSVDIILGPHGGAVHAEVLRDRIPVAGIFIPELCGWTRSTLNRYQTVSNGGRLVIPAISTFPEYEKHMLHLLHGKKNVIRILDVPAHHPISHDLEAALGKADKLDRNVGLLRDDFGDCIFAHRRQTEWEARLHHDREEYMVGGFKREIPPLLRSSRFKSGPVPVAMQLGSVHTGVYHMLRQRDIAVHRSTISGHMFDTSNILLRKAMLGRQPLSDLDCARAIMQKLVFGALWMEHYKTIEQGSQQEYSMFHQLITDASSYMATTCSAQEVEALYTAMRRAVSRKASPDGTLTKYMKSFFRDHDLRPLSSRSQVEQLAGKYDVKRPLP